MRATDRDLSLPPSVLIRDNDQRSAFGKFCQNAATSFLPRRIERQTQGSHQILYFRRVLLGFESPVVTALAELTGSSADGSVWDAAAATVRGLPQDEAADIIRLFVATTSSAHGDGESTVKSIMSRDFHVVFFSTAVPEAVELASGYETFLRSLGNHTRRDMRRLRRKADEAGFRFELVGGTADVSDERHALGQMNHPKAYRPRQIDRCDAFVAAQDRGFHATLRAASGELLSCCAGFISDNAAYVLYQLNHSGHRKASLSLTTRSYLIERLIADGVRELILPGGTEGLLLHSARVRHSGELVLIRRSVPAMVKAVALSILRPQSRIGMAVRHILRKPAGPVARPNRRVAIPGSNP